MKSPAIHPRDEKFVVPTPFKVTMVVPEDPNLKEVSDPNAVLQREPRHSAGGASTDFSKSVYHGLIWGQHNEGASLGLLHAAR